ncbi:hypothetical protein GF367_01285 [Candidatus Woesearchaeota archaeon]|nr:hypothetical protein [Candidatus Woesearchaeota archaeon]
MITLVFSPRWFYGYDIIFEALAVIVTLIIGLYSLRIYRFSRERTYKYFGLSFLSFAAAFIGKIAMNFALYNPSAVKSTLQQAQPAVTQKLLEKSNLVLQAGYDAHRFLFLLALLGIYWIVSKSDDLEHRWFFVYLIALASLFSFNAYFIFHITATIMLLFILKHFHAFCFKRKAPMTTHLNFLAFSLLFLSQLVFIFVFLNNAIYVVAEVVQLLGFIVFLVSILSLVFRHGKKTHKD